MTGQPSVKVLDELSSDHLPCILKIDKLQYDFLQPANKINISKTDWELFRSKLNSSITINNRLGEIEDIDKNINELTASINKALQKSTPEQKLIEPNHSLPLHIQKLIQERNKERRSYQASRNEDTKLNRNRLSNQIKKEIATWKNKQWSDKLSNLSVKNNSLWKMTKSLTKKVAWEIPPLNDGDDIALSNEEKAEALAKNYEKVHKLTEKYGDEKCCDLTSDLADIIRRETTNPSEVTLTSPREIKSIIKSFKNKKAPGKDGIVNTVLKNLESKSLVQVTHIMNACLIKGYFPLAWKEAIILPIYKGGGKNKKDPTSYRPISLLPTLGKLLEKIILARIKSEGKVEELLNESQYGFRNSRSTVMQLTRVVFDIANNLNQNRSTGALFLDIEKAFDTVWHDGLIYKLNEHKIPKYLINIICSFLMERSFKVKVASELSSLKSQVAGVPQGSILGPVLFIIFNNDIITNKNTKIALFADDTCVYAHSWVKEKSLSYLREHAEELREYFFDNKIKINEKKTEAIMFSRKKDPCEPKIAAFGAEVKLKEFVRYLGVILDARLNFQAHINHIASKVNKAIGALYPIIGKNSIMNTKNKLLVYKMIIRPAMLYASPVWGGVASNSTINILQRIQNKCLRMATGHDRFTNITTLHKEANIPTIEEIIKEHGRNFYNKLSLTALQHIKNSKIEDIPYKIKCKLPQLKFI